MYLNIQLALITIEDHPEGKAAVKKKKILSTSSSTAVRVKVYQQII